MNNTISNNPNLIKLPMPIKKQDKSSASLSVKETLIGAGVLSAIGIIEGYGGFKSINPKFNKWTACKFVLATSILAVPLILLTNFIEKKIFSSSDDKNSLKKMSFHMAAGFIAFPALFKFTQMLGVADLAGAIKKSTSDVKIVKIMSKKPYLSMAILGAINGSIAYLGKQVFGKKSNDKTC